MLARFEEQKGLASRIMFDAMVGEPRTGDTAQSARVMATAGAYAQMHAILDTGSPTSMLSRRAINTLQLQPKRMLGGREDNKAPTYLVNIVLNGTIALPSARVTEAQIDGADLVIGMDIIAHGDLHITQSRAGNTVCTFQHPSSQYGDSIASPKCIIPAAE